MPKLRNVATGVVVETSDATAARLGGDWVAVEAEPKRKPKKS